MSRKRSLPDWHESKGFQPDMSLFDGPSDKIIDKIPGKPTPTPQEAMAGIYGISGMGATYEGPDDENKYLDKVIYEVSADGRLQTMPEIISDAPNYQPKTMQRKGGASRKIRKSRRMRRVKTQMRRKNSSRKSTRRRARK